MKNFKEFLNEQDKNLSNQEVRDEKVRQWGAARKAVKDIEKAGEGKTGTDLTRARQNKLANILGLRIKEQRETPENDYEGDMATGELRNIISNAQKILKMLKPESKLEAWVQSKITKAQDYIDTVHDYLKNNPGTVGEAYENLPKIDSDRYSARKGLEGPFKLRSGKVVYYDPKGQVDKKKAPGMHYDPDSDMYMSPEDVQAHDEPRKK